MRPSFDRAEQSRVASAAAGVRRPVSTTLQRSGELCPSSAAVRAVRRTTARRRAHPDWRQAEVRRLGGQELAGHDGLVDVREGTSGAIGVEHLGRIERHADRVGGELRRGAHPFAGFRPVAEIVGLQLDEVAVGVGIVERRGQAVIEAGLGLDAELAQAIEAVEQVARRRELEGGVVQPRAADLGGIVLQPGDGEQREPVVRAVVREPRPDGGPVSSPRSPATGRTSRSSPAGASSSG